VIVAQTLSNQASDCPHLVELVEQPEEVSADAGYCSEDNLAALESREIDAHVAAGRHQHGAAAPAARPAKPQSRVAAMAEKLRVAGHQGPYRLRNQVVEPVFGQIKQARGFRQFLRRGLVQAQSEWALICTVHNLLKLATARRQPQPTIALAA
jgi:IS5 family transposase